MDSPSFIYAHRTADSVYRVPTPPRIVVPPPTLTSPSTFPDISLRAVQTMAFLHDINSDEAVQSNSVQEWTYERRREAQMVLPYLYLGPMTAAKDETWLRREGITGVLGVRQQGPGQSSRRVTDGAQRTAEALGLEFRAVDCSSNQDLIRVLPLTTALIAQHLAERRQATGHVGKVLVFCESGNERSAGVVAAYVMETHEDVNYIKAIQLCQAQRFCANFDDAMKRLLQSYWDILQARRAVDSENSHDAAVGTTEPDAHAFAVKCRSKRRLDRDPDEEMEGIDRDDVQRFGGRQFAPFRDDAA